ALGASSTVRTACADGRNPTAIAELGRRLFFDPAVSRSGTNSCASCHDPEHGWASPIAHDDDDFTPNARHAQPLVDVAERTGRLIDVQRLVPVVGRIAKDGRYASAFEAAFGSPAVTLSRLSSALGEFARTIRSTESPYARYVAASEEAISVAAKRGLELFRGE